MRTRLLAPSLLALTTACALGGPAPPPGLVYDLPNPAQVRYVQGDTMTLDIDAQGQTFQVRLTSAATFGTEFARAPDGIRVSMTVEDLQARMTQPMGAPVTADESAVQGALVFTLDRRGHATVEAEPTVKGGGAQFFGGIGMANSFFPRLPGRAVAPGDTWSDTVRYSGPLGDGAESAVLVGNYTAAGDTTVDGKSLLKVTWDGTSDVNTNGTIAGMDFTRTLRSDLEGVILWDMRAGLMYASDTDTDGRGTMEVSAAPFPLNVRARGRTRVRVGS